ncbi:MAG: chemotaxis protein CheA, partial [Bacteroidales bacterium]|nr:chemotaxis protein CheA [Bacteroidales bacterium]
MDANHQAVFLEEAQELLVDLEDSLLELERFPQDKDLIGQVFRAMHTIKGSGAMFGFNAVASFTHEIETFYDKVREEIIPVTPELINITLIAKDQIRALLTTPPGEAPSELTETISAFHRLASKGETTTPPENQFSPKGASPPSSTKNDGESVIFRIRFMPGPRIFLTGTNPIHLLSELQELGDCEVVAHTDKIPLINEIDPDICYTSWDIILTTDKGADAIKDVFIFVEDDCEVTIDIIPTETGDRKLGEILLDRGDITPEALDEVLQEKKFIGEILVEKGFV